VRRINPPLLCAFLLAVSIVGALPLRAEPIADFYRGKTLRIMIGYASGGGYDLYARLCAEFLGRYIPGNPTIIAQNMPGAGSLKAVQYLNDVAPKDGTYFGMASQTLPLDGAAGDSTADISRFAYIGRLTSNVEIGVALLKTGIKSFDDVRARQYIAGGTGSGSGAGILPLALNEFAGAKFKLVKGYHNAPDLILAMERGEIDVVGATGIPYVLSRYPGWINKGEATIIYLSALKRHPLLPNVPALPELGLTDDGRAVLHAIGGSAEVGRSIMTTPGVPPERLAALRAAFADMIKSPEFLAASQQRNLMIDPGTGEDIDAIVKDTMNLPKPVLEKLRKLMKE